MDYQLIRSNRKTLALVVTREGKLEVRAPKRISRQEIDRFVESRRGWALRHQEQARQRMAARPVLRYEIGGRLPFLGREYPVLAGEKAGLSAEGFRVREDRPIEPQLIRLFRELARKELAGRIERYAHRVGVRPSGLRITSASTRFGSCSGKNSLSFSYKLIWAAEELVDYVVVHELCHIRQHNHSAAFWQEVEAVLPDYRLREQALREFGRVYF